jgi:nucleotide-binding universal stress UspA family protein
LSGFPRDTTGHDTAFRGNVREQLSEIIANLLLITPRPMIVCPDELSPTSDILIAYDGSFTATRAVQLFALFRIVLDRLIQVVSIDSSMELASLRTARAAKYLRAHGYQVKEIPIASRVSSAEALRSEIVNRKIRTAVMGAYGHRGFRERLFGSTTSTLLENPPCALFLYH